MVWFIFFIFLHMFRINLVIIFILNASETKCDSKVQELSTYVKQLFIKMHLWVMWKTLARSKTVHPQALITEWHNHNPKLKCTAWCGTAWCWNPEPESYLCFSTSCTTWALNHRDRNITAAYLCVSPRHWVLSPSLHLHFVAHAKHCHPKSPTNLPPYGSSPQKETAVAWQSHTAPSASAGHVVEERDGLPPCITHSHPLYLPLSKSFIRCLMDHPLPLPITPLPPPQKKSSW